MKATRGTPCHGFSGSGMEVDRTFYPRSLAAIVASTGGHGTWRCAEASCSHRGFVAAGRPGWANICLAGAQGEREAAVGYTWTHDGVARAVEDAMRDYPELLQRFWVADTRDARDYTWHVELDPAGERRLARLAWDLVEYGRLEAIAEQLRDAASL